MSAGGRHRTFSTFDDAMDYDIRKLNDYLWELPKTGGMRVPARIYATEESIAQIVNDKAPQQAANVAHLPGIVTASLAMPDIHWGYGFPIGGVAAFDLDAGVVSPGGVGYDINCGVRLMAARLTPQPGHATPSRLGAAATTSTAACGGWRRGSHASRPSRGCANS